MTQLCERSSMAIEQQPREVRLVFQDDDDCETLLVTAIGPNLYRMEESSVLGDVHYSDVVEVEPQPDGSVRFLRVVTPSELKTRWCLVSQILVESSSLSVFLDKVVAAGGNWERIFGGILLLHLPPVEQDRLVAEFNNLTIPPADSVGGDCTAQPAIAARDIEDDAHHSTISLGRFRRSR